MKITDLYPIINTIYGECVDGDNIVTEDLSNIVDIGKAIFDATSVDKFVGKLCDHIGKVVVDTRVYSGAVPSLIKDAWQYGAVKEKIFMHRLPVAETDTTWGLVNGTTYSQDVFTQPDVEVKFFDQYVAFDITLSIADKQVKSAFDNATQLNSFVSMINNLGDPDVILISLAWHVCVCVGTCVFTVDACVWCTRAACCMARVGACWCMCVHSRCVCVVYMCCMLHGTCVCALVHVCSQ